MKEHIKVKCQKAMYGLHRLRNVRKYLTREATEVLALGTVISHLDYSNALFIGLPKIDLEKLQSVQNKAARLVLAEDAPSSSTQCLKLLHWLPIHFRIQHKVLTLVFKAVHGERPQYLRDMFTHGVTSRNLRSTNRYKKLHIPSVKKRPLLIVQ